MNPTDITSSATPGVAGAVIDIDFPEHVSQRSRKVVTRGRARTTGKYPSWKSGRMIQWESQHELRALLWLEATPDVRALREQPCVIRYVLDGTEHLHYPDLLVERADRKELWEIKAARALVDPAVRRRAELLARELPSRGFQYRLVSSDDLPDKTVLANIRLLLRWGRAPVPVERREFLRQAWKTAGTIRWDALRNAALGPNAYRHVCRLVLEGQITVALDHPITGNTPLAWSCGSSANQGG